MLGGLALVIVVWLIPAPAYAHAVGPGGGVELELLLVAGAIAFFGVKLRSTPGTKPWAPWAVMAIGIGLGVLSFVLPQFYAPSRPQDVSMQIVNPDNEGTVPARKPVEVEVNLTGASVARSAADTSKGHLHIYVDGQLQQMPYSTTAEVTLDPGSHELTVEYVDGRHISYTPPIQTSIEVRARAE